MAAGLGVGIPPGPQEPPRRASRRHLGAYLAAGVLLTVFGRVVIAWIVADFEYVSTPVSDFLKALYDPRVGVETELLTPELWAGTGAMLLVGLVALLGRRAGRGGALAVGAMMLCISVREVAGLVTSDEYRSWYIGSNDLEVEIISTWALAVLISLTVVIVMARAGERPPADPMAARLPGSGLYAASGVLMIVAALAWTAWIVRRLNQQEADTSEYFHRLVDAPASSYVVIGGDYEVYEALYIVAFLTLGVLALLRRPVVRGGAMAMAGIVIYLKLRTMVGLTLSDSSSPPADEFAIYVPSWSDYTRDWEGRLSLATLVGTALMAIAVFVMMLRAPEHPSAPAVSLPGQVPPQPPGQPQVPGSQSDLTTATAVSLPPPPAGPPPSSPPPG